MLKSWYTIALLAILTFNNHLTGEGLQELLSRKVTQRFVDTSVREILKTLARQYHVNMVVGAEISGSVTIHFDNVPLSEALKLILSLNGYHYIAENDVLLIKKFDSITAGELTTRVFPLKFKDGYQLQNTLTPLLSPKGRLEPLISEASAGNEVRRSSMVVVTDLWENLDKIARVIDILDVEVTQLQVEVRLVETTLADESTVGVNLPKSIRTNISGAESTLPGSGSDDESGSTESDPLAAWYQLPEQNGRIGLGIISVDELAITLDALVRNNKARLVSSPTVTTLDNHLALIRVGTTIPVQEVSRGISGDLISFREKEVNLEVAVTPRINLGGKITLTIHPILEEIVGYTGPADLPQPITSKREVQTTVTLNDGETVVIGGLIKESDSKVKEKVWLLGSIPLLGRLFTHTTTIKQKTDLHILITTRIVGDRQP